MCVEAAVLPYVLSALGAAGSYVSASQTAKKQDNIAAQGIRNASARQREADGMVRETLRRTSESNPDADQKSSLAQYMTQLQRTQGQASAGLNQAGRTSNRFSGEAAGAADDIAKYSSNTANLFSRIDGPNRQRQREGIDFARLGSGIGQIGQFSDSDQYLTNLRMRNVRSNPWLDALSRISTAAAGSYTPGESANPYSSGPDGVFGNPTGT